MPEEPGNKNEEQVAVQHPDASGGNIIETSKSTKEDQKQQMQHKRPNGGRHYDLSKKLRRHHYLPIHALLWNIM